MVSTTVKQLHVKYKKGAITILLFLSSLLAAGQYLGMGYSNTHIDFLDVKYAHNIKRHWISGGIAFNVNTTTDDDYFRIYVNDFHAYTFEQHFGLALEYGYDLFQFERFAIQIGLNTAYFPMLGLNRYALVPAGLSSNNELVYFLDRIVIERGSYALPVNGEISLFISLTTNLKFKLGGNLGVMINGDFSNDKIRITTGSGRGANTQVNYGFHGSLQYLLF